MEFDLSQVRFSKRDIEKGIKIPLKLSEDLAEDLGIHTGDGSLYRCGSCKTFELSYSQNINEIKFLEHIRDLKRKLYNVKKFRSYRKGNEVNLRFNSLAIATFYSNIIGLPIGKKSNIDVPDIIKNCDDKDTISAFLRGMIDTDFGLIARKRENKFTPSFEGTGKSKRLIISLQKLFDKLNIETALELNLKSYQNKVDKYYIINKIIIRKKESIKKCMKIIKPNNDKYYKKIKKVGLWRFEF